MACRLGELSQQPVVDMGTTLETNGPQASRGDFGDWSAMRNNRESARYDRLLTARNLNLVERLTSFAEFRGHTLLELACSWLAGHAVVASVIAGASSPAQVRANAGAVGWRLTADEMRQVNALAHPAD